jgi:hypothetical protein
MADEHSQRPYRSSESIARAGQGRASSPASGNDPLAELARLIGQSDPFGEFSRENARRAVAAPQPQVPQAAPVPVHDAPSVTSHEAYAAQDYRENYYAAPANQPQQNYEPQDYAQQGYDHAAYAQQGVYAQGGVPGYPAAGAYDPNNPPYNAEEQDFYDDVPPSKRRMSIMVIAGVFALAIIGTAGAFGYRAVFGSSGASAPPPVIKAETAPSKVVPATAKDAQSNKVITDRVGPQGEKLVSREEKPVGNVPVTPDGATGSAGAPGSAVDGPKKIRTIAITPDQQGNPVIADAAPSSTANAPLALMPEQPMRQVQTQRIANAPQQAAPEPPAAHPQPVRPAPPPQAAAPAPSNAPLSLNPNAAPARAQAPARTASVSPAQTAPSGTAYAVQVTSQRSEAEAEAAYRALAGKYAAQLGGKPHFIHRVDLGAKGTYYRALVGPYASGNEATEVCSSLKAAGGQCIIQRK